MSKQDEAFESWLIRNNADDPHERLDEPTLWIAKSAFAAGREAERERILAAIEATRANYDDESVCDEITSRIKEQEK